MSRARGKEGNVGPDGDDGRGLGLLPEGGKKGGAKRMDTDILRTQGNDCKKGTGGNEHHQYAKGWTMRQ